MHMNTFYTANNPPPDTWIYDIAANKDDVMQKRYHIDVPPDLRLMAIRAIASSYPIYFEHFTQESMLDVDPAALQKVIDSLQEYVYGSNDINTLCSAISVLETTIAQICSRASK